MDRLQFLEQIESNARTYAASFPRMFVHGSGLRVRDSQGMEYLDCLANAGALPLGHNHPEVKQAVGQFIASDHLQQALDLATPAKYEFVQELFSRLPENMRARMKIQFCGPSGSDAVEAALKLARFASKRATILAFHGAYHGMTAGALSAMGSLLPKPDIGAVTASTHFAPYPYRFRCPFGSDGLQTERLSLNYLRTLLTDSNSGIPKPAAVIVELIQGEGGCIPASHHWVRTLREITLEHDVALIVDEVQTGIGRTGKMFAFEHAGIVPDVFVLSKAVGGGYPLAVVLYDERFDRWPAGMHAGTFRGNQIAMVAGRITLGIVARDALAENAERMGARLMDGLRNIASRFSVLADIRGRGLMVGVEIASDASNVASRGDGMLASAIKRACFEKGMIIENGGRHGAVLRFLPPLNIAASDVDEILSRFEDAVAQTQPQPAHCT